MNDTIEDVIEGSLENACVKTEKTKVNISLSTKDVSGRQILNTSTMETPSMSNIEAAQVLPRFAGPAPLTSNTPL